MIFHFWQEFVTASERPPSRLPIDCQSAQLNTIRHVVIWLDPWSRERDLLAAVVDR